MSLAQEEVRIPCNLCGSPDSTSLFTAVRSGKQVVRCRGCGLVFYDPQPLPGAVVAQYTSQYFVREYPEDSAADQMGLAHQRLARIEQEVGKVGRLLDVGCGPGRFLAVARRRGWDAVGMDVSPAAVVAAATASKTRVIEGDLSCLRPETIAAFDVVTLWDVLEHLQDPVGDLRRARGCLRRGGLIVIQTQNVNGATYAWMRRHWEQFVESHLFHFSGRTLRLALERVGFRDISIEASDRFPREDPTLPGEAPPRPGRSALGLVERLRRVRDHLLVHCGYDPFNIMVATARGGVDGA